MPVATRLFEWTDCESILHRLLTWDSPAWKLSEKNKTKPGPSTEFQSLSNTVHSFLSWSISCKDNMSAISVDLSSSDNCFRMLWDTFVCTTIKSMDVVDSWSLWPWRRSIAVHELCKEASRDVHRNPSSFSCTTLCHTATFCSISQFVCVWWFVKTTFESFNYFHICRLVSRFF